MTALLDTFRISLGLSEIELATLLDSDIGNVQSWCSGTSAPDEVYEILDNFDKDIDSAVEESLKDIKRSFNKKKDLVVLHRHKTLEKLIEHDGSEWISLGAHAIYIWRLAAALDSKGFSWDIEWSS